MSSNDPKLPQADIDGDLIYNVKTTIIMALRNALDSIVYPGRKIQGIQISMEYPMTQTLYPHIWVNFSFTKFQNAGIAHALVDESGMVKQEWMFEGTTTLTLLAMTSFERDIYASQLLQLLAFGRTNAIAGLFQQTLSSNPNLYMSINRDSVQPGGQSTNVGTPWNAEDLVYQDSYTFSMLGQMESRYSLAPTYLIGVDMISDGFAIDPNGLEPTLHDTSEWR